MEDYKNETITDQLNIDLSITDEVKLTILKSVKCAKILAISSALFYSLISLYYLLLIKKLEEYRHGYQQTREVKIYYMVILVFMIMIIIPIIFMWKYATNLKKGIENNEIKNVQQAFKFQNVMYVYISILTSLFLMLVMFAFTKL